MKVISNDVWKVLSEELAAKRAELAKANERIDRLTEALARKAEIPLYMPQAPISELQHALEKSSGWFDTQVRVIPPTSGGNKS